jgi:uncharacterized protein
MAAAETIGKTIAADKKVAIAKPPERHIRHRFWDSIPWPVVIGGGLLLAWLFFSRGPSGYGGYGGSGGGGFLSGLLLGDLLNRSTWGSRSSGGFGGPDSGDSFGGFGGGDFGGGGASGDW